MPRKLPEVVVFTVSLVVLLFGAIGGPGGDTASDPAVLAAPLEHAAAPLYGIIAGAAVSLPIGDAGVRLAILAAVLGALTLAGVVAACRALLPKDPAAGVVSAVLLGLAPPLRDAAGFAAPSLLAACGTVWMISFAVEHAHTPSRRGAARTFAAIAIVIGSAPWLGTALAIPIVGWIARPRSSRRVIPIGIGALGVLVTVWGISASGRLPAPAPSLTAMVSASGVGSSAIVIGAGLLGTAFGAVTGLPHARWLAIAIAITAAHAIVIDPQPAPLLGLLAIGCAVIPSAIVRAVGSPRRTLVAVVAGVPLVGGALLTGPALAIDDPGSAPARSEPR